MEIKEKISALEGEMLDKLARLVKYNSVLGQAEEGKPFGEGPAAVLAEGLKIAEELGFRTVNLDNYCGYAEIGEGEEIIGIAGHLDIVPVGDGWETDPFVMTRVGDKVYGRGVTDDKGPVIASLYAMKLLQESGKPLKRRIRVIMGCNEETGSRCMAHYNEVEEPLSWALPRTETSPAFTVKKATWACALPVNRQRSWTCTAVSFRTRSVISALP